MCCRAMHDQTQCYRKPNFRKQKALSAFICAGAPRYDVFFQHTRGNLSVSSQPRIKISTRLGDIVVELNAEAAPKTVANFLAYVDEGFYDGTLFHRVIPGFMIQGGGLTADMANKPTRAPIENEATNGLPNVRGSIAMARTPNPHSATSQFFINLKDNAFLNYTSPTPNGWGYCVFGKVVEGMHVVDAIAQEPTGMRAGHSDVPRQDVVIDKVTRVDSAE